MTNNFPAGRGGGRSNARALFAMRTACTRESATRFARCAGAVRVMWLAMAGTGGEMWTTAMHAGGAVAHLRPRAEQGQEEQHFRSCGAVEGSSARRRCSRRSKLRRRSTLGVSGEWCGSVCGLRAGMCGVLRSEHTSCDLSGRGQLLEIAGRRQNNQSRLQIFVSTHANATKSAYLLARPHLLGRRAPPHPQRFARGRRGG